MTDSHAPRTGRALRRVGVTAAAATLFAACVALAACASSAFPTLSAGTSMSDMSMGGAPSSAVAASATPTHSGPVRCGVTPDASPTATISATKDAMGFFNFSGPVTIKAGEAVIFTNGNGAPHTVTEGVDGKADADACVDAPLSNEASVVVTFYQPGTYQITCKPHAPMQTQVIVQ